MVEKDARWPTPGFGDSGPEMVECAGWALWRVAHGSLNVVVVRVHGLNRPVVRCPEAQGARRRVGVVCRIRTQTSGGVICELVKPLVLALLPGICQMVLPPFWGFM